VAIRQVRQEQADGRNPEGIMFPTPRGKYWRSSNFYRCVLKTAFRAAGWLDGSARWTWHTLRHVFCSTALNTWKLDVSDVSRLAGHSNTRVTFESMSEASSARWSGPVRQPTHRHPAQIDVEAGQYI
jgi:site-specific recombinase XerD